MGCCAGQVGILGFMATALPVPALRRTTTVLLMSAGPWFLQSGDLARQLRQSQDRATLWPSSHMQKNGGAFRRRRSLLQCSAS
jgi:hypothetical protein